ncbi:hypothetical protein LSTR_LSTR008427 [Laodelphax striatellus]|uniref:Uncharacterized protein n=1 Tax=Laodelphax striatellus TaxID=195883 RepID=A0A482XYS6_LAOST|nr:hypothetical protein LSTR_LSTR008427 [Laodelphax striatellus]
MLNNALIARPVNAADRSPPVFRIQDVVVAFTWLSTEAGMGGEDSFQAAVFFVTKNEQKGKVGSVIVTTCPIGGGGGSSLYGRLMFRVQVRLTCAVRCPPHALGGGWVRPLVEVCQVEAAGMRGMFGCSSRQGAHPGPRPTCRLSLRLCLSFLFLYFPPPPPPPPSPVCT